MAVKEFNCNKLKRTFWPFTLKDKVGENGKSWKKERKLWCECHKKQVFEAIKDLEEMDEENAKIEDTDSIYRLLAAVLNNNMGKGACKGRRCGRL